MVLSAYALEWGIVIVTAIIFLIFGGLYKDKSSDLKSGSETNTSSNPAIGTLPKSDLSNSFSGYQVGAKKGVRDYGVNSKSNQPKPTSPIWETDLQNNFSRFSWRQMEELTGKLFKKKGYQVEVTLATGDYGIDVWAKKDGMIIGIQVKKWRYDVGFDDVTKTLGSNLGKANKYILISTSSFFTQQARDHQKQHSHLIELWDTNRFKKELRENFITISSTDKSVTPVHADQTDSFDYDQGFNLDEVYDCPECGSAVSKNFCYSCGKKVN